MYTDTIKNPKTGRTNKVYRWDVDTNRVGELLKANNGDVRAISWALLNDDQSLNAMEAQQYNDSACNNFALSVFENALDWSLGLKVMSYLRWYRNARNTYPKIVRLACNRNGDVFVLNKTGEIIF